MSIFKGWACLCPKYIPKEKVSIPEPVRECPINEFDRQTNKKRDPQKRSIVGPFESETWVGKLSLVKFGT